MAEFPALHLWTDAYLADTTHLTTLENGAYLLLLMAAWRSPGCRLPNDDKLLARFARLTPGQWQRIKATIIAFWTVENGHIYQGRLTDEYNAVRQHSRKQSDRAKTRWLKNKDSSDAVAMPDVCRNDAPTNLTQGKKETQAKACSKKEGAQGPSRSVRKGTHLADDWRPSESEILYARERGFNEADIGDIADDFRTYWTAGNGRNKTHADWGRCWQGWIRRQAERNFGAGGGRPGSGNGVLGGSVAQGRSHAGTPGLGHGSLASAIRSNLVPGED